MNRSADTWYVAVRQPKSGAYVRNSTTFPDEAAAKAFARRMLAAGYEITVGTINPHTPKQIIGPWQVPDWLDGT